MVASVVPRLTAFLYLATLVSSSLRGENNSSRVETHRGLQECAELPTNLYFHLVNHEAHLSLHVEGGSFANGANVVYEYLDDGVHDTFRLVKSGLGQFYHIMAQHSNNAITGAYRSRVLCDVATLTSLFLLP